MSGGVVVYSHIGGVKGVLKGWLGDSIYFLKSEGKEVERKRIKNKKGCEGGVPVTIFLEVEIF